jgi:peptide/nickel transport system substrate-binding protein
MIQTLLLGFGSPGIGPLPPAVWNHHGDLPPDPHDPARARRLLAEAGWEDRDGDGVLERDGRAFRLEILTRQGDPVREQGAVMLRQFLAEVGVAVEIRAMELAAGLDLLRAGRFDAYYGRINANLYGDPRGYVHSSATGEFNAGHYANAAVDSLIDRARALTDRAEALPLWHRLQEILLADPPAAYLFYPENLVGVSTRLQGVRPHLLSPINNLADWWIAPADRRYAAGG